MLEVAAELCLLLELPAPAALTLAMLGEKLASRIVAKQLARVEPMERARRTEQRAFHAPIETTAIRPQRIALGNLVESKDFLHASVAVRAHDENAVGDAEDEVVMKFPLSPVRNQLVRAEAAGNLGQKITEHQTFTELLQDDAHRAKLTTRAIRATCAARQSPDGRCEIRGKSA